MAAATMQVDVVSAEASIYSGEAEFVVLPGEAGELGIYPRHTPLITRIKPGTVRIKPAGGGEEQLIFVAGGILEVQPKVITVLADTAIRGADLDEAKAAEALKRAEEARAKAQDKQEIAAVESELAMLAAPLAAIRRLRKKYALSPRGDADSPARLNAAPNDPPSLLKQSDRPSAGEPMKHILDSEFRYRPSFDTDVRRTFERVRRNQQARVRTQAKDGGEVQVRVLKLDQLKKATNT